MKKLIMVAIMILFPIIAQAQTTGLCNTTPETYVSTNGMVQVRYNVKQVTLTDMDGKSRTAFSYDYKNIPKLEQAEVEKALPVEAVATLKDKPLTAVREKTVGYASADKAAYEAKLDSAYEDYKAKVAEAEAKAAAAAESVGVK